VSYQLSHARADLSAGVIFTFDLELDSGKKKALAQTKERGYAEKYGRRDDVYLVGVNFRTEERAVVDWQVEAMKNERGD